MKPLVRWLRSVVLLSVFGGALQAFVWADQTAAAVTPCDHSIAECGCTITKPGTYTVTGALNSTQGLTSNADCVDIKAANVILNLNHHNATGPGAGISTGAGVRVLRTASNALVEGGNSTLTGWKYGLEIDAANTIVDYVDYTANQVGVFLNGARSANVNDFSSTANTIYGVWIRSGKGNQVNCSNTNNNAGTGFYIGCHADNTHGTTCRGVPASLNNRIYDHSSNNNADAGIVIDIGNKGNVVTDFHANGNMGGTDSIDENNDCGTDQWIDDHSGFTNFGVPNQPCIP